MEFRLLGTVEVSSGGRNVRLGRRRERLLLALLLLEPGRAVAVERLVELLWRDEPPGAPRRALQVYASRLRAVLGAGGDEVRLDGGAGVYTLHVEPEAVDAHRFTALVARARRTADPGARSGLLTEALDLWRGEPLADVADAELRGRLCRHLAEARLSALELRADTELALGRHAEVLAELAELTAAYPASERLVAAHMLALYRCGRQAEALELYRVTAERLAEELGVDPGAVLRQAHVAILRETPEAQGSRDVPVPAQLPADLASFTGRGEELERLVAGAADTGNVVISAIDGMGGVGKTALAVRTAHRLAGRFPDGQLFVDLHGFTKGVDPLSPGDVLGRMLRDLGVAPERVPSSVDERAALYRSLLFGRRVLVVLDNAESEEQVRPLLPGSPGCLVLVTSRRRLTGLDDAGVLSLDTLPVPEAVQLFTSVAGPERVDGDVAEVVELCGRLPLAVRIAAARLRSRGSWTVGYLAERLRSGSRGVESTLELSYRHLDEPARLMFRRLGLAPGADVDAYQAAALAGIDPGTAEELLDGLVDEHLAAERAPGRFAMHDLVRRYAVGLAEAEDGAGEVRDARVRVLDMLLAAAARGADVLLKARRAYYPETPAHPAPGLPRLSSEAAARDWAAAELWNLLSAVRYAAAHGEPRHAWRLAVETMSFCEPECRGEEWLGIAGVAQDAAFEAGEPRGEALMWHQRGRVEYSLSRYTAAAEMFRRAVQAWDRLGDELGAIAARANIAMAAKWQGRFEEAKGVLVEVIDRLSRRGEADSEALRRTNLADVLVELGEYAAAQEQLDRAVPVFRRSGNWRLCLPLAILGRVRHALGDTTGALDQLDEALRLAEVQRNPSAAALSLIVIGRVRADAGRLSEARAAFGEAITCARGASLWVFECDALIGLATLARLGGDPSAVAGYRRALALATDAGARLQQARAHHGLGLALDDPAHLRRALALFEAMGTPEAAEVRAALSPPARADP